MEMVLCSSQLLKERSKKNKKRKEKEKINWAISRTLGLRTDETVKVSQCFVRCGHDQEFKPMPCTIGANTCKARSMLEQLLP